MRHCMIHVVVVSAIIIQQSGTHKLQPKKNTIESAAISTYAVEHHCIHVNL